MSIFEQCNLAPADPILNLSVAFKADTHPLKVDLGVGAYRDNDGKPFVFGAVKKAEDAIINSKTHNHEYTTIDGSRELKEPTLDILFGDALRKANSDRIVSSQALSGTGALRLACEFAAIHLNPPCVYVSAPTWGNHAAIFTAARIAVKEYPYWDPIKKAIYIDGWVAMLSEAPAGSLVLLHMCAHNPTGMDPSHDEWRRVLAVIKDRSLVPIADNAYQGYASGDMETDSFAQRLLLESGLEFILCQSFAKNMGLYGQRMGMVHIVTASAEVARRVESQLKLVVRPMYSSPPIHGAKILLGVLSNPALRQEWLDELRTISQRVASVRVRLADGLSLKNAERDWSHIKRQIGMFSFTGLSAAQCTRMVEHWHVYMLKNGRISLAGLNDGNLEYVIDAMDDCVRNA